MLLDGAHGASDSVLTVFSMVMTNDHCARLSPGWASWKQCLSTGWSDTHLVGVFLES